MMEARYRSHFWCYPCDHDWIEEWSAVGGSDCPKCGRRYEPMFSDDLTQGPGSPGPDARFKNHYDCYRCHHRWTDIWSATCDDDCPKCGARHCTPVYSEDLDE